MNEKGGEGEKRKEKQKAKERGGNGEEKGAKQARK
jgi:hypothetical protein